MRWPPGRTPGQGQGSLAGSMTERKAKLADLAEDYATVPVPPETSVSGFRISLINSALAFSLPSILLGVEFSAMGAADAITAFAIGGLGLALLGSIAGLVGLRNRLSTYMLLRFSFGLRGSKVVNLCMALSLFGWFGVNVHLFGEAAAGLWLSLSGTRADTWLFVLAGGILMTAGAIFGFKSLQLLSLWIVPVQVLVFLLLLRHTLSDTALPDLMVLPAEGSIPLGKAISAVIGSFVVAAVVMPDFTRYGRTWRDSVAASFLPYSVASTIAYTVAALAALQSGQSDILQLMLASGLGVFAFVLVILSSWITNSVNLYGCSLSGASVFPGWREWRIAVVSGLVGTVIAFLGILEHFVDFIFSLGIIFAPVAGIYVVDYFIVNKGRYDLAGLDRNTGVSTTAMVSWLLGIAAAYAADHGWWRLTGIASCDSLLLAATCYVALSMMRHRPRAA